MLSRRILLGLVLSVQLLACLLLLPRTSAADILDDAVAAYLRDPAAALQIRQLRSRGYVDTAPGATQYAGSCGVVGCFNSVLVVHTFRSSGVNTQTESILALVDLDFRGQLIGVDLVELQ